MTESRSGETCRPQTSASSPVLTTTLSADGSSDAARPRRSLAAPVPPASATTRMAYSGPVRETEERHGFAGALPSVGGVGAISGPPLLMNNFAEGPERAAAAPRVEPDTGAAGE